MSSVIEFSSNSAHAFVVDRSPDAFLRTECRKVAIGKHDLDISVLQVLDH